ncbi:hypothetical protein NX02_02795 [Sphingomonas sanxanigenens DSM 19645 = NX02]|uniref:Uncharacterized protein n=1 Tax=Sphingomonas sanxanigenens DSM 19645 = NX02 TaxID=1123269 RepID=W0A764_9SPHN|nr:hypothetical protein NX02_02795 [Sphingomonas sanxanigenens DSM 19645 = NX02]
MGIIDHEIDAHRTCRFLKAQDFGHLRDRRIQFMMKENPASQISHSQPLLILDKIVGETGTTLCHQIAMDSMRLDHGVAIT